MESQIKILIQKFYDGQTTKQDELRLMDYFANGNVPQELEGEREFFTQYFGLDKAEEHSNQIGQISPSRGMFHTRPKIRISRKALVGIAASVVLLLGVGLGYTLSQNEDKTAVAEFRDTYTNPEDAYREANKALALFSKKINEGLSIASGEKKPHNIN